MPVAIIGAGIAGLTAAYTLGKDDSQAMTIYEKSRGFGGRAATRRYARPNGTVYVDIGAQWFRPESALFAHLLNEALPHEHLTTIIRPLFTFDMHNVIVTGEARANSTPRLAYSHGLNTFGHLMVDAGQLNVVTQVRIDQLSVQPDGRYGLIDIDGQHVGADFEQIIFALPAPQAAAIIEHSDLPKAKKWQIHDELAAVKYRRCISVILGFDRPLQPREYSALLNTDRTHDIAWVGFEHQKDGHAPEGYSVLVVQMSGGYSLQHWDHDTGDVIRDVAELTAALLQEDVTAYDWSDIQKWRYSQPDTLADSHNLNQVINGLWFAGDYLRGGRAHFAAESGYEVAQAILQASRA